MANRNMVRRRFIPVAFAVALPIAASCDEGEARFTTKFASDFTPAHHTVSVLGVYKDGRMSLDGWNALAPAVTSALGAENCDVGYDALTSSNGALADAIDEYARADGPTDDLLAQLAPGARGDLVLVLTYAGKLPQHGRGDAGPQRPTPPSAASARGGGRGMRGGGGRSRGSSPEYPVDTNVLDISASLFSIAQGRSVALVSMEYSGTSVDDALSKFSMKLGRSLVGVSCVGWNWDSKIDADRIRKSIDP